MKDPGKNSRCLSVLSGTAVNKSVGQVQTAGNLCKYGSFDIREPVYQAVSFCVFCSGLFCEDQGSMIAEVNATPMSALENKKI